MFQIQQEQYLHQACDCCGKLELWDYSAFCLTCFSYLCVLFHRWIKTLFHMKKGLCVHSFSLRDCQHFYYSEMISCTILKLCHLVFFFIRPSCLRCQEVCCWEVEALNSTWLPISGHHLSSICCRESGESTNHSPEGHCVTLSLTKV